MQVITKYYNLYLQCSTSSLFNTTAAMSWKQYEHTQAGLAQFKHPEHPSFQYVAPLSNITSDSQEGSK